MLFRVAQGGGLFKILFGNCRHLVAVDLGDLRLKFFDHRRPGERADARAGTSLIEHVDGLVGQEPSC